MYVLNGVFYFQGTQIQAVTFNHGRHQTSSFCFPKIRILGWGWETGMGVIKLVA